MVRQMAGQFSDEQIASTLNRLGMRTGAGNGWSEVKVRALRHYHQLPAYDASRVTADSLTLEQAAGRLGVSVTAVRHLIQVKPFQPRKWCQERRGRFRSRPWKLRRSGEP